MKRLHGIPRYTKYTSEPDIFLNLVLSMLAALHAPIIMMWQNRQAARDRFAASALHRKIDDVLLREITELRAGVAELARQIAQHRPSGTA
ncbi:DUF1003 domain-containing protein [Ensifer sp. BR816]|uniref:DUF1003 domain-containing protein n=1 Tax=Rhizobium sp. (strain BR816) TaxID=1057002 RepID=UPI001FD9E756